MSVLHTPHDLIFKRVLGDLSAAKDFLEIYLPKTIQPLCDFHTLAIQPTSFIEDGLHTHTADMLYSLKIAKKLAYVYVLIEHQSTADPHMPFRMLRYQISIIKQHLSKKHKKLPLILPILFYTGKQAYPYSTNLMDYFEEPDVAQELMFKPFTLIDLSQISDEEIHTHRSIAMLEMAQKHIFQRDILNLAYEFATIAKHYLISPDLFHDVIKYTITTGETKNPEEFFKVLKAETQDYKEQIMTIADYLIQKGEQQGIQKGVLQGLERGKLQGKQEGEYQKALSIAKNMLLKHYSMAEIIEVTGLNQTEISALRKHH